MTFAWDGRNGSLVGAFVVPALFVGLFAGLGVAVGWDVAWSLVLSPCPLLVIAFVAFTVFKALQIPTVAVLEATHLRVPASGTRMVWSVIDEGYTYSWKKGVLTVRVPYTAIADVRRVTDAMEKQRIGGRGMHYKTTMKTGATYHSITVRGHTIVGPGAAQGAANLVADELRQCWVEDVDKAVAIDIVEARHASELYPAFPDVLTGITLYVSCQQPDELVTELCARCGLDAS